MSDTFVDLVTIHSFSTFLNTIVVFFSKNLQFFLFYFFFRFFQNDFCLFFMTRNDRLPNESCDVGLARVLHGALTTVSAAYTAVISILRTRTFRDDYKSFRKTKRFADRLVTRRNVGHPSSIVCVYVVKPSDDKTIT